jgi:uncharacterized Fe-S center protein
VRSLADVDILGQPISELQTSINMPFIHSISLPDKLFMRQWLREFFGNKPVIYHKECSQCLECQNQCPNHAIHMNKARVNIDYETCIRCYCCSEICPNNSIALRHGLGETAFVKFRSLMNRLSF